MLYRYNPVPAHEYCKHVGVTMVERRPMRSRSPPSEEDRVAQGASQTIQDDQQKWLREKQRAFEMVCPEDGIPHAERKEKLREVARDLTGKKKLHKVALVDTDEGELRIFVVLEGSNGNRSVSWVHKNLGQLEGVKLPRDLWRVR